MHLLFFALASLASGMGRSQLGKGWQPSAKRIDQNQLPSCCVQTNVKGKKKVKNRMFFVFGPDVLVVLVGAKTGRIRSKKQKTLHGKHPISKGQKDPLKPTLSEKKGGQISHQFHACTQI